MIFNLYFMKEISINMTKKGFFNKKRILQLKKKDSSINCDFKKYILYIYALKRFFNS